MAKASNYLMTVLIAIVIGISALSVVPTNASAAVSWTLNANAPLGNIYQDQYPTFSFSITNDGGTGLDVWDMYFYIDWAPSTHYDLIGSTHITISAGATSSSYSAVVHVPAAASVGSHTVSIKCTGQAAGDWLTTPGSWTWSKTVSAVPTLVVASTGANPNSGTAPLNVQFNPSVSGGLSPYTYSWTFGDGGTSTSASPSHQYTAAGSFTATVVVTDTETVDQVKSASTTITVALVRN